MSHTRGPWTVWSGAADMEPRVVANGGRHAVAAVKLASHNEHEANARVIAAAPELLAALQAAVARVRIANAEGNPILSAWLTDAVAVIAKATGGQ